MNSPAQATARRSLPIGLFGTLGLILAVELSLSSRALDFTRFYIDDWTIAGSTVERRAADCSVLCFGDSLVKFGVLPQVLQQRTGERVYNLSVCGGQAASSYFLLRRALAAAEQPKIVLVDFAPHLLSAGPRHNLRQWPELLRPLESVELGLASKHAGFCAELALRSVFPSINARDEIRGVVVAALKGKEGSRRADVLEHRRIWEANLGADVHPDRPTYQGEIDAADRGYFPRTWSCHPTNAYFIERFLELAASRRVQVVWLLPPVVPRFQGRRDQLGLEAAYQTFLTSLSRKHANLSILDARRLGFDHSLFVDPLHLNRRGAVALSARIAEALTSVARNAPSASSWIDLAEGPSPHKAACPTPRDTRPSNVAYRSPSQGLTR